MRRSARAAHGRPRAGSRTSTSFPFPTDTPVPYAEAVFDRVSVEIARGCTEGCRFCQAGMIYRPVRERDPDAIVKSVVERRQEGRLRRDLAHRAVDRRRLVHHAAGQAGDGRAARRSRCRCRCRRCAPTGSTRSCSTRCRRCAPPASPSRPRPARSACATSSTRTSPRRTSPRSAEKIFSRGWSRMKCYFMIGLPTETDEDVAGIAQTGGRLKRAGQARSASDADVTVSVSLARAQAAHAVPVVRDGLDRRDPAQAAAAARRWRAQERVDLKWHEAGDQPRRGHLVARRSPARRRDRARLARRRALRRLGRAASTSQRWHAALDALRRRSRRPTCGTRPGRRAAAVGPPRHRPRGRLPRLGVPARAQGSASARRAASPTGRCCTTPTSRTPQADQRKLVCYDCGIACDLTQMREERIVYLRKLDARKDKPNRRRRRGARRRRRGAAVARGMRQAPAGVRAGRGHALPHALRQARARRVHLAPRHHAPAASACSAARGVEMIYSKGFHPKPQLVFAPALGLGVGVARRAVRRARRLRRRRRRAARRGCARPRPRGW